MPRPAGLLAAIALLTALTACASTRMQESLTQLNESVEGYNEAYRWKNYERAAAFLPPDLRAAFIATYEDDSLHIEDYQIVAVNLDSERAATVTLRLRYMLLPSVNIDKRVLVQHWHKLGEAWILESEDNSIREIARAATPKGAAHAAPLAPGREGDTRVRVTNPKGDVIRPGDLDD